MSSPARANLRAVETTAATVLDDQGKPVAALKVVQDALRLPQLTGAVARGRVNASFDLLLSDGSVIAIGPLGQLAEPKTVALAVGDHVRRMPPTYTWTKTAWLPIVNAIMALAETIDDGLDPNNVTRGWIRAYLQNRIGNPVDLTDERQRTEVVNGRQPFIDTDGQTYLPLEGSAGLAVYVNAVLRDRQSTKAIAAALARIGFERRQISTPRPARKRASFHVSPPGFDADEEDA